MGSLLVDKAMKFAKPDKDTLLDQRRLEEAATRNDLEELFHEVDYDGSGTISSQELVLAAEDQRVLHKFEMLVGITLRDVGTFFSALTAMAENGNVSKDAFVDGCLKMKGAASSLDVLAIRFQVQDLWRDIHRVQ